MGNQFSTPNKPLTRLTPVYEPFIGSSWTWVTLVAIVFGYAFFGRPAKTVTAPAAPEVYDIRWDQMVSNITTMSENYKGDVGVYIKDLKTGRSFNYKADKRFISASLIKLPIMAALFEGIRGGDISLNSKIMYTRKYWRDGAGNMKWGRTGMKYPISYLVYAMITKSDNIAAAMLIDLIGYDKLNQRFSEFGLKETRIGPTGMSLASKLDPNLDNYTTPREMGLLLEKIYRHQIGSDGLSDLMLEIMKGANAPSRLARYLPRDFKLARKTGLLRKNCHDVGILFTPEGDYVICVLTGQNKDYKMAKSLISSVGKKVYDYAGHS